MLSFHLSVNVIIIVVSFKILDLCPIALFQQLWNTLYILLLPLGMQPKLHNNNKKSITKYITKKSITKSKRLGWVGPVSHGATATRVPLQTRLLSQLEL